MTKDRHDYSEFDPLAHRHMLDPELVPVPEETEQVPREVPAALRGPAWQPEQTPVYAQPTQWNGEPCTVRRITAVVVDNPGFPMYWARHLVGTRRAIAEVTYGDATFYLDDEDGSAWNKVTHGGSPHWPHNNITIDPSSIQPRAETEMVVETTAMEPVDTCRTVEVDGQTVLLRGEGELREQEKQFAAEIVRAAKRKFEAEHTEPTDTVRKAGALRQQIYEAMKARYLDDALDLGQRSPRQQIEALTDAALLVILPHGKFLGDQLRNSEEQLLAARAETERWIAFIQRGMDTHMRFSVLGPDGTAEQLPCADRCYACHIQQADAFKAAVADLIAGHEGDEWASHPATTTLRTLFTQPVSSAATEATEPGKGD